MELDRAVSGQPPAGCTCLFAAWRSAVPAIERTSLALSVYWLDDERTLGSGAADVDGSKMRRPMRSITRIADVRACVPPPIFAIIGRRPPFQLRFMHLLRRNLAVPVMKHGSGEADSTMVDWNPSRESSRVRVHIRSRSPKLDVYSTGPGNCQTGLQWCVPRALALMRLPLGFGPSILPKLFRGCSPVSVLNAPTEQTEVSVAGLMRKCEKPDAVALTNIIRKTSTWTEETFPPNDFTIVLGSGNSNAI